MTLTSGIDRNVLPTRLLENGDLILGTWQGLYFCEFDGPRQRKVHIKVIVT